MTYKVITTRKFDKDVKRCQKRGLPLDKLKVVVKLLAETGQLPSHYRPHKLSGKFNGVWECHIMADWLLIWEQRDEELLLLLTDTGSHSEIFG